MKKIINIGRIGLIVVGIMLSLLPLCAHAQSPADSTKTSRVFKGPNDPKVPSDPSVPKVSGDLNDSIAPIDTLKLVSDNSKLKTQDSKFNWTPNPQRALWLALVIPGGGQIYNRKFWKLPIFYGGMMGCIYAMTWNNMMYKDYSQAYLDIMDSDPTTESYNKFLHLGTTIDSSNEERYKKIFKSRKDKYRRWRDLSVFCLIGVYALSVIDAYVDAELSEFDISNDLSLRIQPAVFNSDNSFDNSSIGLQCSLNF